MSQPAQVMNDREKWLTDGIFKPVFERIEFAKQ